MVTHTPLLSLHSVAGSLCSSSFVLAKKMGTVLGKHAVRCLALCKYAASDVVLWYVHTCQKAE